MNTPDSGQNQFAPASQVLDAMLSSISDFVYVFDRAGRFLFANKPLLDLWGLPLEQAVGKNFFDLGYPDALAVRLQAQIQHVIDTRERVSDETEYTSPSGAPGYYEYIFTPVIGVDGSVEVVAGSTRDISHRKAVEEELRVARKRLGSALIAGEIGTFEWDIKADRLYGDQNFERLFSIRLDSSGAAPLADFVDAIHPDDQERTLQSVRHTLATGEPFEAEYRIMSGCDTRWVIARGKLEHDADSQPALFHGVLLDITGRRFAEQEQRVATADLDRLARIHDTILTATDDFAYVFDCAGRFLYANRQLLKVWDKTLEQVLGKTCLELGYPEWHAEMHMREIEQVIATRKPIRGEVPFTGDSGISGIYDYTFTPVFAPDGEVECIAGTTRDVTAYKRIQDSLRDADRMKDEFLAQLAHELRNPLAPIRNSARVLRLQAEADPASQWASSIVDRQMDHITRLIDDLLDVSRISSNKLELRVEKLLFGDVVKAAAEGSSPMIDQFNHNLILSLPFQPVALMGDMVRLTQVFMNLLTNAAKYTEAGGRIWLEAERAGDEIVVRVRDSGVGIAPDKLPHVFDMFFQADRSLERAHSGLGIGLSLVKRIVELHGGRVSAASAGVGLGSEFTVRLPVLAQIDESKNKADASTQAPPVISRRVLVVDDNRDAADSLSALLQLTGNEVATAYDGLEAIAAAEHFRPDVVLLDIGMPQLNGYEACRRIRAETWGRDIFLVAQTGWGQDEDKRRTSEAGFDRHLVKPVEPQAVLSLLASLPVR